MLQLYQQKSIQESVYPNNEVQKYLRKASREYSNFQQYKLIRNHSYNEEDFPKILAHSLRPIFAQPIKQSDLESIDTKDLFKVPVEDDSITSKSRDVAKRYSDYQAKVVKTVVTHYTPHTSVPDSQSIINSFKWYLKLVENTPLFIIVKADNRLFSDSSINQYDKPVQDMKNEVKKLQDPNATRSYHFTDLTTYDLFNLAVKTQNHTGYKKVRNVPDALVNRLNASKHTQVVDRYLQPIEEKEVRYFFERHPIRNLVKELDRKLIKEIFPFDLEYSSYYLLCIEDTVIEQDHGKLFDLLENSPFEVVGARLSLSNNLISKFFKQGVAETNTSYESLLKRTKEVTPEEIENTMKRLGELGLTHVEEGCHNNCIYLLPEPEDL